MQEGDREMHDAQMQHTRMRGGSAAGGGSVGRCGPLTVASGVELDHDLTRNEEEFFFETINVTSFKANHKSLLERGARFYCSAGACNNGQFASWCAKVSS